ncbi:unnamed protein product [Dovyalis caffra]|uniref:Uncharacterized protein n=1 Tax=Dovyalis caffra TaxID=77055 RepID=A0AAV1RZ90_9ROSI|nr:unnamed protein product [Dovyalis caffra]
MVSKKSQKKMVKGVDAQLLFPKSQSSASKAACAAHSLCVVEMLSLGGSQSSVCHLCVEGIAKWIADPENSDFNKHLAEHEATLNTLNKQYADMLEQLEAEKQRGRELEEMEKVTRGKSLLDAPIDNLNLQELEKLQQLMGEFKGKLLKQIEELSNHNKNPTSSSVNLAEAISPSVTNPGRASSADDNCHDDGHEF